MNFNFFIFLKRIKYCVFLSLINEIFKKYESNYFSYHRKYHASKFLILLN